MYKERLRFALNHNIASYLLLLLLFWLIRLLEFFQTYFHHPTDALTVNNMLLGGVLDVWTVLILSAVCLPLCILSYLIIGSFTRQFQAIWLWLVCIVYFMLVGYYIETSVPLGADFWGYSLSDIQTTVKSSAEVGIVQLLPIVVITGLLLFYYRRFQEYFFPTILLISFYTLNLAAVVAYCIAPPSPVWFGSENAYAVSINKLDYFSSSSLQWLAEQRNPEPTAVNAEYPLMHKADTADVLSPFFDSFPAPPNIVVIIVEGLGGTFVGPHARYGGCTPFLDSLASKSLFWENTLSNSGRTFGVLPSLLGSLPYGEHGFMEEGSNMPAHITLLSLLKEQGYNTRYFYGGNINFDKQDVFLERQNVDFILNENKFPNTYVKSGANKEGFSWGYSDDEVFRYSLENFPADTTQPQLSVYLTLSTHEPFIIPQQEKYLNQVNTIAAAHPNNPAYGNYKAEFASLLFTDNAIRNFMNAYSSRADYANTVFVITGDHRMVPVPHLNRLDRFRVPLILFSPRINRPQTFAAINTHLDFVPTLLPFIAQQGHLTFISEVPWLGSCFDTTHTFNSTKQAPIMRTKNELQDFIGGPYFYADKIAYKITPELELIPENDARIRNTLRDALDHFKQVNAYVIAQNKIYDKALAKPQDPAFTFTKMEKLILHFMGTDTMNPEQLFAAAQFRVVHKQFENAQLICRKTLLESPNYTDIRLLYANTFAWQQQYDKARSEFIISIKRESNNREAWRYYIQNEIWNGTYDTAMVLADSAYQIFKDPRFKNIKAEAHRLKYGN